MHTKVLPSHATGTPENKDDLFVIQIKLIGVILPSDKTESTSTLTLEEHYLNTAVVLENCLMTFKRIQDKLLSEKLHNEKLLSTMNPSDSNFKYLKEAVKHLDLLLLRRINLNENVLLYDFCLNKESSQNLMSELELITIQFNKIVPLELKNTLRDHLIRYRKSANSGYSPCSSSMSSYSNEQQETVSITSSKTGNATSWLNLEDFIHTLKSSKEITHLIKTNMYCKDLTLMSIVNYAKTIGEIFWLKFNYNSGLNKKIFLKLDYIINCLQLFIKHDKTLAEYDSTIGYFRTHAHFNSSIRLAKNYGILEHNLIKSICFTPLHQLNQPEIDEALTLLSDLLFIYKSSLNPNDKDDQFKLDEKMQSYFSVVCPTLCTVSFDKEKSIRSGMPNYWESDLYSDDAYELFFDKLDHINMYREKIRLANGIKKETIMYNLQDILSGNDYYKELENMHSADQNSSRVYLINI